MIVFKVQKDPSTKSCGRITSYLLYADFYYMFINIHF